MSFTTTLRQAVQSAGAVYVNGHLVDSNMYHQHQSGGRDYLEFDLRSLGAGVYTAQADQQVRIDENGDARLTCAEGESAQLNFQVAKPLTADLVAKAA